MSEPMPVHQSETSVARAVLAPFCVGVGLDIGFGGDPIVPSALTMDMVKPYTTVGASNQLLQGSCENLSMFCNESLDYIYSSHLLEDFTYEQLVPILLEWKRVLKHGGRVITNCPDQRRFLAHCAATGQGVNLAHKEPDFSISKFRGRVLAPTGPWTIEFQAPKVNPYSWYLVVKKP